MDSDSNINEEMGYSNKIFVNYGFSSNINEEYLQFKDGAKDSICS